MTNGLTIWGEPGSTHEGKLQGMQEAIGIAHAARCTGIKFQWCSSPEHLARRRHAQDYVEAYRALAFPADWLSALAAVAKDAGLEFACTTFLPEDVETVVPYVQRLKIASLDATDLEFVRQNHETGLPLVISTGGLSWEEVARLLPYADTLLHCGVAYPLPREHANLRAITSLIVNTGRPWGYSDHTATVNMGALAVAAGATFLEVHFRLESTSSSNADYPHSLNQYMLANYCTAAREAWTIMGDGIKRPQPSEAPWLQYQVRP